MDTGQDTICSRCVLYGNNIDVKQLEIIHVLAHVPAHNTFALCEDINNVDVELHDTIHCFLNLQIAECSVITLYQVL